MAQYNTCEWLVVQQHDLCGKRCVQRFCGCHRAQLRRRPGTAPPRPCRACGRGTKAETQLCSRACGTDLAKYYLVRAEKIHRLIYPRVLRQLLDLAHRQRTLPFIGVRK